MPLDPITAQGGQGLSSALLVLKVIGLEIASGWRLGEHYKCIINGQWRLPVCELPESGDCDCWAGLVVMAEAGALRVLREMLVPGIMVHGTNWVHTFPGGLFFHLNCP